VVAVADDFTATAVKHRVRSGSWVLNEILQMGGRRKDSVWERESERHREGSWEQGKCSGSRRVSQVYCRSFLEMDARTVCCL